MPATIKFTLTEIAKVTTAIWRAQKIASGYQSKNKKAQAKRWWLYSATLIAAAHRVRVAGEAQS